MKKDGPLFELIKSLTKSEKRFIKIYASRYTMKGKNNYLELFDIIDKLNENGEKNSSIIQKSIKVLTIDNLSCYLKPFPL